MESDDNENSQKGASPTEDRPGKTSSPSDASSVNEAASLSALFLKILAGQEDAFTELYRRLAQSLEKVARRVLQGHPGGKCDAEEVVQSVFVSFWQRTRERGFDAALNRNELWKLLATITARKALNRIRNAHAQKRGGGQVRLEADIEHRPGEPIELAELAAVQPAQVFGLACEDLLSKLDEECRTIAILKTMNHTNLEIADLLQCTERKVERKLELTRRIWEQKMSLDNLA